MSQLRNLERVTFIGESTSIKSLIKKILDDAKQLKTASKEKQNDLKNEIKYARNSLRRMEAAALRDPDKEENYYGMKPDETTEDFLDRKIKELYGEKK